MWENNNTTAQSLWYDAKLTASCPDEIGLPNTVVLICLSLAEVSTSFKEESKADYLPHRIVNINPNLPLIYL